MRINKIKLNVLGFVTKILPSCPKSSSESTSSLNWYFERTHVIHYNFFKQKIFITKTHWTLCASILSEKECFCLDLVFIDGNECLNVKVQNCYNESWFQNLLFFNPPLWEYLLQVFLRQWEGRGGQLTGKKYNGCSHCSNPFLI